MFAGHVGAALAIGRCERRVNIGIFVIAALLLDLLLWLFVLLGWESASIPANFASTHQPEFVFPYSHGLLAGVVWSLLAGAVAVLGLSRLNEAKWRAAALIAGAAFSHWLLDALVHAPELPITGAGSQRVGLGLWQTMPVAVMVESLIVLAGLWLFIQGTSLSRAKQVSLTVLALVLLAFTAVGMTVAPPPPSSTAMAGSSLVAIPLVCALASWLGRPSR